MVADAVAAAGQPPFADHLADGLLVRAGPVARAEHDGAPASPDPRTAPRPDPPSVSSAGSITWRTRTWWPRCRRNRSAFSARSRSSRRSETKTTRPRRRSWPTTRRSAGSAAVPCPASRPASVPHQLAPVAEARARRQHRADLVVERDEAGRVALAQQHQRERGDEALGVGELGQDGVGIAGPGHGPADVAHHHGAEVGLFLELLDVQPVVPAEDLPVDVAELVARLVHPVLGELDREPAPGRAVQPAEKSLHHTFGDHLDPAELRDVEWIEEIESAAGHDGRNVSGFSVAGQRRSTGVGCPARVTIRRPDVGCDAITQRVTIAYLIRPLPGGTPPAALARTTPGVSGGTMFVTMGWMLLAGLPLSSSPTIDSATHAGSSPGAGVWPCGPIGTIPTAGVRGPACSCGRSGRPT